MAQTTAERRAAQRKLAKEIHSGTYKKSSVGKAHTKAVAKTYFGRAKAYRRLPEAQRIASRPADESTDFWNEYIILMGTLCRSICDSNLQKCRLGRLSPLLQKCANAANYAR